MCLEHSHFLELVDIPNRKSHAKFFDPLSHLCY